MTVSDFGGGTDDENIKIKFNYIYNIYIIYIIEFKQDFLAEVGVGI